MRLTKIIFSLVFLCSVLIGSSINVSVSGKVLRENNNAPLEGANVVFVSEAGEVFGASTDVSGKFNLENLPSGRYNVTIRFKTPIILYANLVEVDVVHWQNKKGIVIRF